MKYLVLVYLFTAVLGLGFCVQALSSCGAWASHCGGFSCRGAQTLGKCSVAVVHRLSCPKHGESFRTWNRTYVLCFGRWILNHWTTREVPNDILMIL